jgi:molybdopterin/thiamine biosynthesis adenylyltransferase
MTKSYSVAIPGTVNDQALAHLIRSDGQEDLCFATWRPSQGAERTTALIHSLILPREGERRVHGNASFMPRYFERAVIEAATAGAGLAFFHSHPGPGWQDMSHDDIEAEKGHAAAAQGATSLPLIGLTAGNDRAWSGRFWIKSAPSRYERQWCSSVRSVGSQLSVTFADHLIAPPKASSLLQRTTSAWGPERQGNLARVRIGIVGAGSVGSIIAEALARTGFSRISLIDFDTVEAVNLDRLLHAYRRDAAMARSKVETLARGLRKSATSGRFIVDAIEYSVAEETGFRAALDCDVLFSCVDRPWARSILNFIAYSHLIPVIDGGVMVKAHANRGLLAADWRAHIAGPSRRCLECLEQYDPGLVAAERDGYFDDPRYIEGLPNDHPLKRNENVFAFSMSVASLEILQMLTMILAPFGVADVGAQRYHFVPGIMDQPSFEGCKPRCPYSEELIAMGDNADYTVTGKHTAAEKSRAERAKRKRRLPWRARLLDWIRDRLDNSKITRE